MVAGLICALYGALLGWLFGRVEANETLRRIRDKEAAKLPHAVLLVLRAALLAPMCNWMGGADHWAAVLLFVVAMMWLVMVHRSTYNIRWKRIWVSVCREWWYMGSCRRYIDDSWYDTLWWIASAKRIDSCRSDYGRRYLLIRPRSYILPWLLATCFECLIATGAFLTLNWLNM